MKDINKSLELWLNDLTKYELTEYEKLPDIDLYMDQVITWIILRHATTYYCLTNPKKN